MEEPVTDTEMVEGFNGNFEKWFAKDEPKHRIRLDPTLDIRAGRPDSGKRKKDKQLPKLPEPEKKKEEPKKQPPPEKKKKGGEHLSLERLWHEIIRLKNSKVDVGEFYKL